MQNNDIKKVMIMIVILILSMIFSINNPKTLRRIGDFYNETKNISKAEKYYQKASQKGDIKASFNYSCLLIDKDPEKALKLAIISADGGLPEAMYNAGTLSLKKSPPDLKNAEKYLELALKNDIKKAYTNLGICYQLIYEKDKSKKEYEEKSLNCFQKGAENKDEFSMVYLSYHYAKKKDFTEAKKWLDMAKNTESTSKKPEKMMKDVEELIKKHEK